MVFLRRIHGSEGLTGQICIATRRLIVLIFNTLKIRDTLTTIYPPRYSMHITLPTCYHDANSCLFQPLAPANGAPPDATRDPMLRDKVHGAEILDVRKALAFAGFTHKSPRAFSYVRADRAFDPRSDEAVVDPQATVRGRGRSVLRELPDVGRGRAISM